MPFAASKLNVTPTNLRGDTAIACVRGDLASVRSAIAEQQRSQLTSEQDAALARIEHTVVAALLTEPSGRLLIGPELEETLYVGPEFVVPGSFAVTVEFLIPDTDGGRAGRYELHVSWLPGHPGATPKGEVSVWLGGDSTRGEGTKLFTHLHDIVDTILDGKIKPLRL